MTLRTVGSFLWSCILISTKLFFAAVTFGCLLYACFVLGYWLAETFLVG